MLSKVRAKAWQTRREKYGPAGHSGSYSRCNDCRRAQKMEDYIVKLHNEGVLSEGQAAKATGLDRITLRFKADELNQGDE